jgi:hypothetical protein
MAFVIARLARAGGAEGLAGAASCPNRSIIGPAGEPEGDAPSTDASEEVTLRVASDVVGLHVNDGTLVNVSRRDLTGNDEVAEPLSSIGVNLVVVGTTQATLPS